MLSNAQIQQQAHGILQQEEFKIAGSGEPQFNLMQWLWDTLKHALNFHLPFEKGNAVAFGILLKVLLITLLVVVVAVPLWMFGFWIFKMFRKPDAKIMKDVTLSQRRAASLSYTKLSEEALEQGNYRLAMHYLFLAAVSWVIRAPFFAHREYLTSREILGSLDFSGLSAQVQLKNLFATMHDLDEPRWFGDKSTSKEDFKMFEEYFTQFQKQMSSYAQ